MRIGKIIYLTRETPRSIRLIFRKWFLICTVNIVCNRITRIPIVVIMNKMKNKISFLDDTEDKHWEEMKPQMLKMVDGQAMVTRSLTA